MSGTIRQRRWKTTKGQARVGWVADYFDREHHRQAKLFKTKREATTWLNCRRQAGEIWVPPKERDSDYPADLQKRLNVGILALRLDHALTRIERLLSRIEATGS